MQSLPLLFWRWKLRCRVIWNLCNRYHNKERNRKAKTWPMTQGLRVSVAYNRRRSTGSVDKCGIFDLWSCGYCTRSPDIAEQWVWQLLEKDSLSTHVPTNLWHVINLLDFHGISTREFALNAPKVRLPPLSPVPTKFGDCRETKSLEWKVMKINIVSLLRNVSIAKSGDGKIRTFGCRDAFEWSGWSCKNSKESPASFILAMIRQQTFC